jgi:hypothetical protein
MLRNLGLTNVPNQASVGSDGLEPGDDVSVAWVISRPEETGTDQVSTVLRILET